MRMLRDRRKFHRLQILATRCGAIFEYSSGQNGTFYVCLHETPGRCGQVSIDTCRSQLLHEIQGKRHYNSDIVTIIYKIKLKQGAHNLVYVSKIDFDKPPITTKVGITAQGGYQAEAHYIVVGVDTAEKVQLLGRQWRHYLDTDSTSSLIFTTSR
jgi:hypothetical protein